MGKTAVRHKDEGAISFISCYLRGNSFPEEKMMCSECVHEMHTLGGIMKLGAADIQSYLVDNYCPTVEEQELCVNYEADYYIEMLEAIVNHFFVDGATHICQVMGMCDVRRYTCEECVEGLQWEGVAEYFPGMHQMVME